MDSSTETTPQVTEPAVDPSVEPAVEQTVESPVEQTVEQTVEPTSESHVEQPVVVISLKLTDADREKLALANGYHAEWLKADPTDGHSLNSDWGKYHLENVPAAVLAWALLASIDHYQKRLATDPSQEPILVAVARSVYIDLARRIIKISGTEFLSYPQRINHKKEHFNNRVHTGMSELKTPLGDSSIWSLAKRLDEQVRSCVNRCYEKKLSDLPIVADVKETKSKKASHAAEGKRRETARSRAPEDALSNNRASPDLALALYDISKQYNLMLASNADFSQAYRERGAILRELKDKRYEDKKNQYEAKRAERENEPQSDVKPSGPQHRSQNRSQNRNNSVNQNGNQSVNQSGNQSSNQNGNKPNNRTNTNTNQNQSVNRRVQVKGKSHSNQVDSDGFKKVNAKNGSTGKATY